MSFIQNYWKKTLQETYKDVKEARDQKDVNLSRDCFLKNKDS